MTYNANYAYPNQGGPGMPGIPGMPVGATSPDDLRLPLYGATFGQAVKRFFKNYVNFNGRASRSEYWFAYLFVALLSIVPAILYSIGLGLTLGSSVAAIASDPYSSSAAVAAPSMAGLALTSIGGIILGIISLGIILPQLAITWRRLHDANFAGPFFFLSLIPGVGSIILLVLTIMGPKPEGQRFDR